MLLIILDLVVLVAGVTWSQNKLPSLSSSVNLNNPTLLIAAQFHRDPVSAVESYHQDDMVIILPGVYSVSSTIVLPDSITIEGKTS